MTFQDPTWNTERHLKESKSVISFVKNQDIQLFVPTAGRGRLGLLGQGFLMDIRWIKFSLMSKFI